MKMFKCTFTYPVNDTSTPFDIAYVAQHEFHHIESHLTMALC